MTGPVMFACGDGVGVKALKEAYERNLEQLMTKSKQRANPVEKPYRRLIHSVNVIKVAECDSERLPTTSENRPDEPNFMCDLSEDVFSSADEGHCDTSKERTEPNERYTGTGRVIYYPIGYHGYYALKWMETFRRVIEELQQAQAQLEKHKDKRLKKIVMESRLPVSASPKPNETLMMARNKLRRSTDPGGISITYD